MITYLNKLQGNDWQNLKKIVIFGCGRQGIKMLQTLQRDFEVVALVDNDEKKQGTTIEGYIVKSMSMILPLHDSTKIIVTASQTYYQEIKSQLEGMNLVENVDFVMYQQFIAEWYYRFRQQINVIKADVSVTSKCTLNCEHCMQFLPYWKEKKHRLLEAIKEDVDIFFRCVDYLMEMDVLGGEPLVYPQINEVLDYIGTHYRNRIGYLGIITNGTIVPSEKTLQILKKYNVRVSVSDYSNDIEYKHKIPELIAKLKEYDIAYIQNANIEWYDFGFPQHKYSYRDDEAKEHMRICNTVCHVLNDKKYYYCGLQWAAQEAGLFKNESNAYLDLDSIDITSIEDKRKILEMMLGNVENGFLKFCKVCGGFGIDNNNRIKTAVQFGKILNC